MKRIYSPPKQAKKTRTRTTLTKRSSSKAAQFKLYSQPRNGFPEQMILKSKYIETPVFTVSTSGTTNYMIFAANGLFDPNITLSGHQPSYFDQMMQLYNHYYVIKSYISVEMSASEQVRGAIALTPSATPPTSVFNLGEQTKGKAFLLAEGVVTKFSMSYDSGIVFGSSEFANADLHGDATSNPTELSYYQLGFNVLAGSPDAFCQAIVTIYYTAAYIERINIASSS